MTRANEVARDRKDDRMLEWTMRIIGFALAGISLVFLTQDIVHGANATYFFSISAGLGIVTLITSWMPLTKEARLHESQAARYAETIS